RRDPIIARPIAKIARQRSVRVVEKDIGLRARGERSRASGGRRDVRSDRRDLDAGRRPYLRGGLFQCIVPARNDDYLDAFLRERKGPAPPQASAGAAQQRLSSADSEIHFYTRDERHLPSPRGRRSSRGDGGNGTDLVAVALVEGEVLHDANALGERLALELGQRLAQVRGRGPDRRPPPLSR